MSAFDECRACNGHSAILVRMGDVPMCPLCAHEWSLAQVAKTDRARALLDGLKREHLTSCRVHSFDRWPSWRDLPPRADISCDCGAGEHNARVEEAKRCLRGE